MNGGKKFCTEINFSTQSPQRFMSFTEKEYNGLTKLALSIKSIQNVIARVLSVDSVLITDVTQI